MAANIQFLLKQYDTLKTQRSPWEQLWQDQADMILPNKSNIGRGQTPGVKQTSRLFDSTAVHANSLLAASMQGSLTSNSIKWFTLRMREDDLNDQDEVKEWLNECGLRMYAAFAHSNLHAEILETYLDLGAFGTGCLLEEEMPPTRMRLFPGLRFRAVPIGEFCVEENETGMVDGVWRAFKLPARACIQWWGNNCGPKIQAAFRRDQAEMMNILHVVRPRLGGQKGRGVTARGMMYESVYIGVDDKSACSESGFQEFPYFVPRWTKASGETYGRGPGHIAMPDIQSLNTSVRLRLKMWSKVIEPPLQFPQGGVAGGKLDLTPGGQNQTIDGAEVKPLFTMGNLKLAMEFEDQLRNSIRTIFFSDQLQLKESPRMTAEEVRTRYELMQRLLGPTLGRLEAELLDPLIERTFQIMYRAGALPDAPDAVIDAMQSQGGEIDVQYEGPLSKAQRSSDVFSVKEMYEFLIPLSQARPQVMDIPNHDEVIRHMFDVRGLPPKLLNSEEQVDMDREAAGKLAEDQAKLASAEQASVVAKNLLPAFQTDQGLPTYPSLPPFPGDEAGA